MFFIFSTFLDTVLGYILILFFFLKMEKRKGMNGRNKRIKIKWLQYSELIDILFSFIPDRIIWKRWKGPQKEKEKRTRKKKKKDLHFLCGMNLMYFYINRASCTYNNLLTISILLAGFIGWTVFSEQAFLKVFLSMSVTLFIYLSRGYYHFSIKSYSHI